MAVRSDYFELKIRDSTTGEVVAEGDGSFLAYVQIDGRVYWQIGDQGMQWNTGLVDGMLLPSDSSCRGDIRLLADGRVEEAEVEKKRLEDL